LAELQQETRISVHRAADIADEHERTHLHLVAPALELDGNAAVLHALPERPAVVDEISGAGFLLAAGLTRSEPPVHAGDQTPRLGDLIRSKLGEVLLLQHLARAENDDVLGKRVEILLVFARLVF